MKIYKVKVNGKVYEVELESVSEKSGSIQTPTPQPAASSNVSGQEVKAPVAGNILDIRVAVGSSVKRGQIIAILEAMKLENEILSPTDGVIKQILVTKGQAVSNQQLLVVIG